MARMMIVIGIKDAAKILRESGFQVSEADLRAGLDQKVYPFGDSVVVTSRPVYHIYEPLLRRWIDERSRECS